MAFYEQSSSLGYNLRSPGSGSGSGSPVSEYTGGSESGGPSALMPVHTPRSRIPNNSMTSHTQPRLHSATSFHGYTPVDDDIKGSNISGHGQGTGSPYYPDSMAGSSHSPYHFHNPGVSNSQSYHSPGTPRRVQPGSASSVIHKAASNAGGRNQTPIAGHRNSPSNPGGSHGTPQRMGRSNVTTAVQQNFAATVHQALEKFNHIGGKENAGSALSGDSTYLASNHLSVGVGVGRNLRASEKPAVRSHQLTPPPAQNTAAAPNAYAPRYATPTTQGPRIQPIKVSSGSFTPGGNGSRINQQSPLARPPEWINSHSDAGGPLVRDDDGFPRGLPATPQKRTVTPARPKGPPSTTSGTSVYPSGSVVFPDTQSLMSRPNNAINANGDSIYSSTLQTSKKLLREFCRAWITKSSENQKAYVEGGYCKVSPGDVLNDRYQIAQKLGWGEFSTVWLVIDRQATAMHRTFCALKIAKCRPDVTRNTKYECYLMNYLREQLSVQAKGVMSSRKSCLGTLMDVFEHRGQHGAHLCMVMPLLGSNLLCIVDQFKLHRRMRKQDEIQMVKHISLATLRGLDVMARAKTLHTDIKPENVLVGVPDPKVRDLLNNHAEQLAERNAGVTVAQMMAHFDSTNDPEVPIVRIADFGLSLLLEPSGNMAALSSPAQKVVNRKELNVTVSGTLNNVNSGMLIQTREYRAPEVLFGTNFNCRTDLWSVGCMVYELITGNFLFDPKRKTRDERAMDIEHLAMIMQVLGPVPGKIARPGAGKYTHRYFDENGRFLYTEKYRGYGRRSIAAEMEGYLEPAEAERAAHFIMSCFTYDPSERITAADLMKSSWLKGIQN